VEGGLEVAKRLVAELELCTLAENLGATETLVTHSASMTHADVPRADRLAAGIGDGLIRVSLGLEDPRAIVSDIARALERATAATNAHVREVAGV
jgi:methionine-gamma-lyase